MTTNLVEQLHSARACQRRHYPYAGLVRPECGAIFQACHQANNNQASDDIDDKDYKDCAKIQFALLVM